MLTSLVIFIQTVQAADASSLKERPSLRQKWAENRVPQIRKARKRIGMLILKRRTQRDIPKRSGYSPNRS
ncbi:hypothetical protein ACU8KH_00609 [Lachancea thermotolerans]